MSNAAKTFGRHAHHYDADRRKLIPCFDEFYTAGLRLIAAEMGTRPLRILDLGAGTGLFSEIALDHLPVAEIRLLDGAPEMLERAKLRLAGREGVSYQTGDFLTADLGRDWDAVISALAIHHLPHDGKRALFARIHGALRPGGRFVNAEQVEGPSPVMDAHYARIWDEDIRTAGVDQAGVEAAAERMSHDICAPVTEQLAWMHELGYHDVDCLMKSWRFAVMTGRRAPTGG